MKRSVQRMHNHQRSTLHRHFNQIKALLESKLTFRQIGRKLGVSHERVRQIAKERFGMSGHERMNRATRTRHISAWLDLPLVRELPTGIGLEPIQGTGRLLARIVSINGHRCRLTYYHYIKAADRYSIRPRAGRYDFILYFGPKGWLIFPWRDRIRRGTTFGKNPRHTDKTMRHDFWAHLECWGLLGKLGSVEPEAKQTGHRMPRQRTQLAQDARAPIRREIAR